MDNESGGNWVYGAIVIVLLVIWIWPDHNESYQSDYYNEQQEENSINRDCIEPENPYDYGSGHYAGYEWAQDNDVYSCDGNSDSFIEGCEEYLAQEEDYEICTN